MTDRKVIFPVSEKSFNAIPKADMEVFLADYNIPAGTTWGDFKELDNFVSDDLFVYDNTQEKYKLTWHSSRYKPQEGFELVEFFTVSKVRRK